MHGELVALVGAVNRVIAAATERAPIEEIDLRVAAARASQKKLEEMTGSTFGGMDRHLWWLEKNHREGHPTSSDGDIADLRDRDLPAAVEAVSAWAARLLDAGLVAAITRTWEAQDYDGTDSPTDTKCEALMRFEPSLAIREDHRGWLSQPQRLEMLAETTLGAASAMALAVMSAGTSVKAIAVTASSRREQRGPVELDDMYDGHMGSA